MSAASAVRGSALCPSFPKALYLVPALPYVHLVVHSRRYATRRVCARCGGSRRRLACRLGQVFALLPPDVHHDMAAQQKHMPNLPPKVGVCICTQAGPGDAWDPAAWRGICSSRSGRTRRRLSFMGRGLSAGPLSGVALMSSARAGERCRDSPMRRSHYIISRPYAGYPGTCDTTSRVCCIRGDRPGSPGRRGPRYPATPKAR